MSSSDYTSAIGGGLKLKGAKDAGIERKKKKKKKKPRRRSPPLEGSDEIAKVTDPEDRTSAVQKALADEDDDDNDEVDDVTQIEKEEDKEVDKLKDFGKTEAQRRHEERRRKRLDERLKREGIKTHKERVEELNKYLSGLSEHHDMPRIGPG